MGRRVTIVPIVRSALAQALILLAFACSHAFAFPADGDWTPVYQNQTVKQDPNGDSNGARNVVSDGVHSTTFYANDGTYIYFRLRLDDDPSGVGGQGALRSFGWGVELDTNMDDSDYEWLILVDGITNPEEIKLGHNTVQGVAGDPSDVPESYPFTIPVIGNILISQADTSYNNDQDYFLSWRFSLADFKAASGLGDNDPIRLFEGSSSSANTLTANGADYVGGDTLQAGFSDYMTLTSNPLTTGAVKFVSDASGNGDETTAVSGDTLYIRVDDADRNTSTSTVQIITVTVTSPNGESEVVALTETGVNTGVFVGQLGTAQGVVAGAGDDGTLVVDTGDSVQVAFNDPLSAAGIAGVLTDAISITVPTGADGAVTMSSATDLPGDPVTVTVTDPDLDANPGGVDTTTVSILNQDTGETETITLTETGANTGVFAAQLTTVRDSSAGANNDGAINVSTGNSLQVTYNDAFTSTGGVATVTDIVTMDGTSGSVTISSVTGKAGTPLNITVTDVDLNTDPSVNDTIVVQVVNQDTGEIESLTLTETGINSGVFTAQLTTTQGASAGSDNDGSLIMTAGNNINVTYNDSIAAGGGAASVADSLVAAGSDGSVTISSASGNPGDPLTISVTDSDLNASAATIDSVTVQVVNQNTGEIENVVLVETGLNTGVFTAQLATWTGVSAGNDDDGTLIMAAGDSVEVTYNDNIRSGGGSASVTDSLTSVGSDGAVTISSTTDNPGDPLTITVTDPDLNVNAAAVDTVTAQLVNQTTGETETVTLTETGANTGIFKADVPTSYGVAAGSDNDGALNASGGDTLLITYNDAKDSTNNPAVRTDSILMLDDVNAVTATAPIGPQNSNVHDVTGETDPFSTVTMTDPVTGLLLITTADANGDYTFSSVAFPEGTTVFSVQSVDPGGNPATAVVSVKVDSINNVTVSEPTSGSVISELATDVVGTTDPDSTVTLVEPGTGNVLTTTADSSGDYSFSNVKLNDGVNALSLTSTDPFGNVATTSATVTVDQSISLNITSVAGGATYNTTNITLSGKTDPGATVTTTHPTTGATLTTTADASGNYSFGVIAFSEGAVTQTVTATDQAGNTANSSVSFTIDTTNSNSITSAAVSTVSSFNITGTTDPGSVVTFKSPVTGQTFSATADAAGNYSFGNIFFPDGVYAVATTSTDPAGNIATASANITVSTKNDISANIVPGNSLANVSPLPINGTTTPGSTVSVTDPVSGAVYVTTADAFGDFSFAGITLAAGENVITVVSTDPNGVTTSQTSNITYDVNISLTAQYPVANEVSISAEQTVSGTTVPNATVTMKDPITGATLTTTADASGDYSFGVVTFPQGSSTVTITSDDGFGNSASISNTYIIAASGQDAVVDVSENVVLGEPIFVTVSDPETYLDPTKIDTVQVTVSNITNGDSESQTLVETGPATGDFTGQVNTVSGAASDGVNSGVLIVQKDDVIVTTFSDPINSSGNLNNQSSGNTDITNDAIKITVNVYTVTGAGATTRELSATSISILEYDADGGLTGRAYNYVTDSTGLIPAEFIGRMESDKEYRVLINDPIDGYPYSQSDAFTLADLEAAPVDADGARIYALGLDPAGYVYDALTGARVNGADVTLYHRDGSQVAGPFALFTQDPSNAQTNPQLSGDSGMPGGFEFVGSSAASDLTAGYYYIEITFDSDAALGGVYYPVSHSSGDWAGISEPYAGQEFLLNEQNQPIGMRVPLYRRAADAMLSVSKSANKAFAASGDIVTFTITVRNPGGQTDANNPVVVRDALPHGLVFLEGSAYLDDGTPVAVSSSADGALTFTVGRLDAAGAAGGGDVAVINYMATVGTSARPGMVLKNEATALIAGVTLSNTAVASVRITDDPLFDRATLIGRVFLDANENGRYDRNEKGLGGVGLIMEDGTYVTTGPKGMYSVPGAKTGLEITGTRVIKIDMNTLPYGTTTTTTKSSFVTLRPGDIDKANFGVLLPPDLMPIKKDFIQTTDLMEKPPALRILFTALVDGVFGDVKPGFGLRPDTDFIPSDSFAMGRVAYFYSLNIGKDYSVVSSYDSHKRHSYDLFGDRNRDSYYPTYGSGGSLRYLAETQGRFYLKARTPSAELLIGNYEVAFPRTELAGVRRALSGVKFEFRKKRRKDDIEGEQKLLLFSTRRKQLHARSELRATGGTNYYLAHSMIVPGSEKIIVQARDSLVPERVNFSYELVKDEDYEIDYFSGRLRLFTPVAAFVEGDSLYHYGLEGGDPAWIVAEYSFTPEQNDFGSFGARYLNDTGLGVTVGMSYMSENYEGRDHNLRGIDFHVGPEDREKLVVEYARSESGGAPRMASFDAGNTFITLDSRNAASGGALKCRFTIREIENLEWENYYYLVDPDFSGLAFGERGVRRAGSSIAYGTDTKKWLLDYTRAGSLIGAEPDAILSSGGGRTRTLRFGYREKFAYGDITAEYVRDYQSAASGNSYGLRSGAVNSYAMRYERKLNKKVTLLMGQQVTFQAKQHHRTTLGARVAVSRRISFTAEGTAGTAGTGGRIGFERNAGSGSKTYVNVSSGRKQAGADREIRTVAGYSKPLSKKTDAYVQMETRSRAEESVTGRTIGLSHHVEINRVITMAISAQRSEERSSLQGRYFTNTVTWSGAYERGQTGVEGGVEYRDSQGAAHKHYFGCRLATDAPINSKLSSFMEYVFEVSDDLNAGRVESKYAKALVGLAWRPAWSDRLNLLGRAGRVRELRPLAANDSLSPDSLATVLSMEGIYDASHEFQLRGKTASKHIRERLDSGPAGDSLTLLHIAGFTWRPSRSWYLRSEYRAMRQPSSKNLKDGAAVEVGRYVKDNFRLGVGYNFSSHTDDEFAIRDNSYHGLFITFSGKM